MMQFLVYRDTSEVRLGRLAELKTALHQLAAFVAANEPRLLAYNVYFTGEVILTAALPVSWPVAYSTR